jgi:hypothetical protein
LSTKTLTEADILTFFQSRELPQDPVEAERLLARIAEIANEAIIALWQKH